MPRVDTKQPKRGQSASILGYHSLKTGQTSVFRGLKSTPTKWFLGAGKQGNNTMVRLRQNNTEAFESHFFAVFESFSLDHFKS